MTDVQTIGVLITAASVSVAAIYYIMTLRVQQTNMKLTLETRQAQFMMQLNDSMTNVEVYKDWLELMNMEWTDLDVGTIDDISKMIAIEDDFWVSKQIGIVHSEKGFQAAKEIYPHRFIFAKYLSMKDIVQYNVKPVLDEYRNLRIRVILLPSHGLAHVSVTVLMS